MNPKWDPIVSDPELTRSIFDIETEHKRLESGYVGRIFGSSQHTQTYVVAVTVILLLSTAAAYTFLRGFFRNPSEMPGIVEFWTIVLPVVTTCLGYLFGRSSKS